MKYAVAFCLALALLGFAIGCALKPESKVLKVGLVLPLTGDAAFYGADVLAAAKLWQKEHPSAPIEIVVEDAQLDAQKSILAARKLIEIDRVEALYSVDANPGRALKRLATQYKVLHFSQSWDATISDRGYNIVYNHQPADYVLLLIDHVKSSGAKRIALLYMRNNAFTITAEEIERQAKEAGVEIVATHAFAPGVRDFRTELAKLKALSPDLLIISSFPPELDIIGRQIKELGWPVALSSVESFDISTDRKLWEGAVYVSGMDQQGAFAKKFRVAYVRDTIYPGFIWDILDLLAASQQKVGNDAGKLLGAIQATPELEGIIGPAINNNGTFKYRPFLVRMVDGLPERL